MPDFIKIQAEGYEWMLRQEPGVHDADVDEEVSRRYGVRWGQPEYDPIFAAFERGTLDAFVSQQADAFMSIADAAMLKGVSEQAIRDILRNAARREKIFPRAERGEGDPRRAEWRLHLEDVDAWKPRRKKAK